MVRRTVTLLALLVLIVGCGDPQSEGEPRDIDDDSGGDSNGVDGGDSGLVCDHIKLIAMDEDPDEGYIDITDFCVAELNKYRAVENLEPYTVKEDGRCCSAREAHQAWVEGGYHNGDYCDWVSQGAAGGGRNPNGTAKKSVEWVPRLFWGERGDSYEDSGGHYQAMMRPETREVACGFYAANRDEHRIVVNYW